MPQRRQGKVQTLLSVYMPFSCGPLTGRCVPERHPARGLRSRDGGRELRDLWMASSARRDELAVLEELGVV